MKIINLLPKPRQRELGLEAALRGVWIVFFLSLLSFGLVFAGQEAASVYLNKHAQELDAEIALLKEQVKRQENSEVKAKVKAANDLISDFKSLSDASPKWSKVIKAFLPLPPEGLSVSSFRVDPANKSISISGKSPTRELVIQLYNNISADTKNFSGIDYPLENVAKPTDINFHFTFFIKEELLK